MVRPQVFALRDARCRICTTTFPAAQRSSIVRRAAAMSSITGFKSPDISRLVSSSRFVFAPGICPPVKPAVSNRLSRPVNVVSQRIVLRQPNRR